MISAFADHLIGLLIIFAIFSVPVLICLYIGGVIK